MRTFDLKGVGQVKSLRITASISNGRHAGDQLDWEFIVTAPNLVCVTDFAHVCTGAGFVYVASFLDIFA